MAKPPALPPVGPRAPEVIESSRPPRRDPTSSRFRQELAAKAFGLRNEQVTARVVYYGAEQATSPELDAVTEAVVSQLAAFQEVLRGALPTSVDAQELEILTIRALREALERLFGARREHFLRFRTQEVSRRVSKLFFASELGSRLPQAAKAPRVVRHASQGVYYAVAPHLPAIEESLAALRWASPDLREKAIARVRQLAKEIRVEFLRQTTKELERVLHIIGAALASFFQEDLVPNVGDLAWRVVKESRVVERSDGRPQVVEAAFPDFRNAFDRIFLELLVNGLRDRVEGQLASGTARLTDDTLVFLAAPDVYVEICSIVCDSVYDFLHSEGFLDLPVDWRTHLHRVRTGAE